MSYIKQTLQCKNCKLQINVSLGTYGGGMPERCPQCNYFSEQFEKISDEWSAEARIITPDSIN